MASQSTVELANFLAREAAVGLFDDADDDDGGTPPPSAGRTAREAMLDPAQYANYPNSGEEDDGDDGRYDEDDEDVLDDLLMDTDWSLGAATNRYRTIAGGGQRNSNAARKAAAQAGTGAAAGTADFQPMEKTKLFQRIKVDRINDRVTGLGVSRKTDQEISAINRATDANRVRRKDKSDRATVEQVLDPRTRTILFKLLKNEYITEVNGTISTGKEANVYHAVAGEALLLERNWRGEIAAKSAPPAEPPAQHRQVEQTAEPLPTVAAERTPAAVGSVARSTRVSFAEPALAADAKVPHEAHEGPAQEPEPEPEPELAGVTEAAVEDNCASVRSVELAVKIFKTSILVFKDRDRYVTGDYRFRHGYSRHNPRKMVKAWAEKEYRNLNRLHTHGIRCPTPRMLRNHVLLMDFVGVDGLAAPRLKDATLSVEEAREAYMDCVRMMWLMYHGAKLVHGDLSEYNILWHEKQLWFIDVSQSVEHDHPSSFDFLRKDCENVTAFFRGRGVGAAMTLRELFDFITDLSITESNFETYLDKMAEKCSTRAEPTARELVAENVFKQAFIPKRLSDIEKFEQHVALAKNSNSQKERISATQSAYADLAGTRECEDAEDPIQAESGALNTTREGFDQFYHKVVGLDTATCAARADAVPEILRSHSDKVNDGADSSEQTKHTNTASSNDHEEEESDETGDEDDDDESDEDDDGSTIRNRALCELDKKDKKAHKRLVKEQNRERRKEKVPKKVKKRKKTLAKRK